MDEFAQDDFLPAGPPPLPPLWKRFVDAIFSPGRMGEYLAENPRFGAALFVVCLLVGLQLFLIPPEIFQAIQREAALESGQDLPEMSDTVLNVIRWVTPIFAALSVAIFTPLFAGLYALVFVFILGDEGRYRQYLSIVAHAGIVGALMGLLLTPLRISTENPQLTLNLGTFFQFLGDGYLVNVLTVLDFSQIWASLIVAVGATKIDPRRSFGSAATILLSFLVVLALTFGRFM